MRSLSVLSVSRCFRFVVIAAFVGASIAPATLFAQSTADAPEKKAPRGTLTFTPKSLPFAKVQAGTSKQLTVNLTNTSKVAIAITKIAATGAGFSPSQNCLITLAALTGACPVVVMFSPATAKNAKGTKVTGTLTITDNASNSPQKVTLSATKFGPVATPTPTPTASAATPTPTPTSPSSGSPTPTPTSVASYSLAGVAAVGDPLPAAAITLKDQNGTTKTATTGSDGSFSINITGLTSPFLLEAVSADGKTTLFSAAVSPGAGNVTANVHPYTDLAVRAYYAALNGSGAATVFNSVSSSTLLPAQTDLNNLSQTLGSALEPTLAADSVANPAAFSIFSTPFNANQTGFDLLLHDTAYTPASSPGSAASYAIDTTNANGELVENGTVTAGAGSIGVSNTVSNTPTGGTMTTSSSSSAVNVSATTAQQQSDEQGAVAGIQTLWTNLANVVNTEGSALTTPDLAPFIDPNALDRGTNASAFEQQLVQFFTQTTQTVSFQSVPEVYDFTEANGQTLITAEVLLSITANGSSYGDYLGGISGGDGRPGFVYIKESDGSYRLYGDQSIANMDLDVQSSISYNPSGTSNNGPSISINARAPFATPPSSGALLGVGTVSNVTVANTNGNTLLPNCTGSQPYTLNQAGTLTLVERQNNGQAVTNNGQETFDVSACGEGFSIANPPPSGTQFLVTFNTPSGGSDSITAQIHSQTAELPNLVSINGQSPATFLSTHHVADVVGTALTLTWTLPATFQVESIDLEASPQDANGDTDPTDTNVSPAATSGSAPTIPATLQNGNSTTSVNCGIQFFGANGERIDVNFNITPQ